MPIIKYKKTMESMFRKPVFCPEDMHNAGVPEGYSKKLLHTLAKSGKITRIERGKYTCLDDPIAVAPYITQPSYLSLWTAMSIRGLTTQVPFAVEVVTSRRMFRKTIDFKGTRLIFRKVDPEMMFGYENVVWKENARIPIAKPEKIIIDSIVIGGMPKEEIAGMVKKADVVTLKAYAKLTGDRDIVSKVEELIKRCSHRKK